jgi:hypothetical protein
VFSRNYTCILSLARLIQSKSQTLLLNTDFYITPTYTHLLNDLFFSGFATKLPENAKEKDHAEDLGVDGRRCPTTLKEIGGLWIELIWFRIECSGTLL